ncbi:hypothetical protein SNL152K_6449 [Streptomyces sp. NL15-2K]|nr:hypothetical protein SNL152K_6449 [Streptomyces sp. NL15-2K]
MIHTADPALRSRPCTTTPPPSLLPPAAPCCAAWAARPCSAPAYRS